MKIETWYDIKCSKCGAYISTDFEKGMYQNKIELNKIAKETGWQYSSKTKENICPNCLKKVSE